MTEILLIAILLADVQVQRQHVELEIRPNDHRAIVRSEIVAEGDGELLLKLTDLAELQAITLDADPVTYERRRGNDGPGTLAVKLSGTGARTLRIEHTARFEQDVEVGEKPGQVHNFTMNAHVGKEGVFLSEGSAWHPLPLDARGNPVLHRITVDITPLDGWACVASGDPVGNGSIDEPCWQWRTPRPADGLAVAGNRHVLMGRVHETAHGPIEIVMHVPESHRELVPMFLDAAGVYLDLYVPRLGPFPYRRFSIVENFFSSGFAYPGFTLLGPRVVSMAPRSLMPGFLDHEMVHNWWGNGVYIDPDDGNWCEALTTFCTNYYRRIFDDGPDAGRDYRRTTLMKLSADPETLDDAPLGDFGSADPASHGAHRFVGYDKGAFVLAMLEQVLTENAGEAAIWSAFRRFADEHMGRRADWADFQAACEAERPDLPEGWLNTFFQMWLRVHTVPVTPTSNASEEFKRFLLYMTPLLQMNIETGTSDRGNWVEFDPQFRFYRVLPPSQIVPLIGGTRGKGGLRVVAPDDRPEARAFIDAFGHDDEGENLMLIGAEAIRSHAALLARTGDPIIASEGSFTVGGVTYEGPNQAAMHSMTHPDRPGRFITAFVANGEVGWAKLRLIVHYRRDTTVIWEDGDVIHRRVHEPDRRIYLNSQ